MNLFLKGIVIGFSIAAPVGPIGVLCIRRSLAHGTSSGLAAGLGAATADAAYGAVAGFGLTAVSNFLSAQQFWLGLFGGAFLCYLGVKTFLSPPAKRTADVEAGTLLAAYASTFVLTLANPATILSFIGIFASFGLAAAPDYGRAGLLVLGVFLGSACWWMLLSSGVAHFRDRADARWMRAVNRISGTILFAFGAYALTHLR
jgi:threonine/homoserine/homoserine lactone efflux protein